MASDWKHVNIEDRVTVVDRAWPMSELQLLARTGEMVLCDTAACRKPLEKQAEAIRDALGLACGDMRERCAREAAKHADECVADAIRALDL